MDARHSTLGAAVRKGNLGRCLQSVKTFGIKNYGRFVVRLGPPCQ